jgi:hypothetical protein
MLLFLAISTLGKSSGPGSRNPIKAEPESGRIKQPNFSYERHNARTLKTDSAVIGNGP